MFSSNIQETSLGITHRYWVTEQGQVFNVDFMGTGKVREVPIGVCDTDIKTKTVSLEVESGGYETFKLHNIVCRIYNGLPPDDHQTPVAIHRDGDGNNCFFGNLYWADAKYVDVQSQLMKYSGTRNHYRAVVAYTEKWERIRSFPSIREASKFYTIPRFTLMKACEANMGSGMGIAGEHRWKYLDVVDAK
jgi:hypothetical protein